MPQKSGREGHEREDGEQVTGPWSRPDATPPAPVAPKPRDPRAYLGDTEPAAHPS